jgi:hypothetical protein
MSPECKLHALLERVIKLERQLGMMSEELDADEVDVIATSAQVERALRDCSVIADHLFRLCYERDAT